MAPHGTPIAILVDQASSDVDHNGGPTKLETLQRLASERSWQVIETIARTPRGNRQTVRAAAERILELAEAGSIRKVLAHEISSIGRKSSLALQFLRDLHAKGVSFHWYSREIETLLPDGNLSAGGATVLALLDEMSRAENARRSERVLNGLEKARDRGRTLGRPSGTGDTAAAILERYPKVVSCLAKGNSLRETARLAGVAQGTVQRVKRAMRAKEADKQPAASSGVDLNMESLPVELL